MVCLIRRWEKIEITVGAMNSEEGREGCERDESDGADGMREAVE